MLCATSGRPISSRCDRMSASTLVARSLTAQACTQHSHGVRLTRPRPHVSSRPACAACAHSIVHVKAFTRVPLTQQRQLLGQLRRLGHNALQVVRGQRVQLAVRHGHHLRRRVLKLKQSTAVNAFCTRAPALASAVEKQLLTPHRGDARVPEEARVLAKVLPGAERVDAPAPPQHVRVGSAGRAIAVVAGSKGDRAPTARAAARRRRPTEQGQRAAPACACILPSTKRASARVMQQGSAARKIRRQPRPEHAPPGYTMRTVEQQSCSGTTPARTCMARS